MKNIIKTKGMKTILTLSLVVLLLMGFNTEFRTPSPKNLNIVLVLRSTLNKEYFSKFNIIREGNSLLGENIDYDYPIPNGIYRIESASNDYYYSKHIVVNEDIYYKEKK